MTGSKRPMRVGCQTFTWEMLGPKWTGSPDDILDAIAAAGYTGVEFSNAMIGHYWERPDLFEAALAKRGLACAAFAYATTGFTDPQCFDADFRNAQKSIRFAAHFSVPLCLGGPSSPSRDDYDAKLAQACTFFRHVADLAARSNVTLVIHPHSHHTSLVLTPEEYDHLLAATADLGIKFNPDTGHLLRGGHDVLACLKKYRERIVHVHLKQVDASGHWQQLDTGICNFQAVLSWLGDAGYTGWVIVEEESDAVWNDPSAAITEDRHYLQSLGY